MEALVKIGFLLAFLTIVGGLIYRTVQNGEHLDPTWAAVLGSLIAAISSFRSMQRRKQRKKEEEDG
ncbi:hypothetical protein [Meiothermus granaticius]|uniref:Uncharacterized protein n=1 Tax=Meiothermus granaticius NBRC 107808 TaxID=1227551 RepID=A0A399F5X9_9DEIN|nr:hypothetical protein [Meiothermus granaticius]RIH90679.1 hypothetical protein Mgrana_03191 [Meiothermus granaticius NBRC 107808]GEM88461.1 hypothetical protein MGR01S_30860 [Meiothermus granaticius NBRC 107808]